MSKIDYIKEFDGFLNGTTVYSYEECPVDRDLFILGSEDFNKIIPHWKNYFEYSGEHPNNYINYKHASCYFIDEENIDVYIEINIFDRFHAINKSLKKSDYLFCFKFYERGERPFIVVEQSWFDSLEYDNYSCYSMIDIIGIRALLKKKGKVPKEIIDEYNLELDKLALENPNYLF